jgi:hypothetical protein
MVGDCPDCLADEVLSRQMSVSLITYFDNCVEGVECNLDASCNDDFELPEHRTVGLSGKDGRAIG